MHESSGISIGEVLVCLGTDVSSGVKEQKTSVDLGQNHQKLMTKQRARELLNLPVIYNIIQQYHFTSRQQYVIVFNQKDCKTVTNGTCLLYTSDAADE